MSLQFFIEETIRPADSITGRWDTTACSDESNQTTEE